MLRMLSRDRAVMLVICIVAAAIGYGLRDKRPGRVKAVMAEALELSRDASAAHERLRRAYSSGALSNEAWADAIEAETIPRWHRAVECVEQARREGAQGADLDLAAEYFAARLEASRLLIAAIRSEDRELLESAMARWSAGADLAAKFAGRSK